MRIITIICVLLIVACGKQQNKPDMVITRGDSTTNFALSAAALADTPGKATGVVTGNTKPTELVAFAYSLKGIPYKYASSDPKHGFDCSGFVSYVFTHFGIEVPRSSVEFTDFGREVPLEEAKTGDLILFTGTDKSIHIVGHMGIIAQTIGDTAVSFIHASSGSEYAVTETQLNDYYMGRYVKIIRIFPENDLQ